MQHSVENGYTDSGFRTLACQASGAQAGTDDRLVAAHRCLDQRTSAVAGLLLPTEPAFGLH